MKRVFDFVVCLIGLILLSPLMLVLSLLIVHDSPGGIFSRREGWTVWKDIQNL